VDLLAAEEVAAVVVETVVEAKVIKMINLPNLSNKMIHQKNLEVKIKVILPNHRLRNKKLKKRRVPQQKKIQVENVDLALHAFGEDVVVDDVVVDDVEVAVILVEQILMGILHVMGLVLIMLHLPLNQLLFKRLMIDITIVFVGEKKVNQDTVVEIVMNHVTVD